MVITGVVTAILLVCALTINLTPFAAVIVAGGGLLAILIIKCLYDRALGPQILEHANNLAQKKVNVFKKSCHEVIWKTDYTSRSLEFTAKSEESQPSYMDNVKAKLSLLNALERLGTKSADSPYLRFETSKRDKISQIFAQICQETPIDCTETLMLEKVAERLENDLWETESKPQKKIDEICWQKLISDCHQANDEINALLEKIRVLNAFIKSRVDLSKICSEYMKKYSEYINLLNVRSVKNFDPENIYDQRTQLQLKVSAYTSHLEEAKQFIERHKEVYDCYMKCVNAKSSSTVRILQIPS